jgi:hypothetical protein
LGQKGFPVVAMDQAGGALKQARIKANEFEW